MSGQGNQNSNPAFSPNTPYSFSSTGSIPSPIDTPTPLPRTPTPHPSRIPKPAGSTRSASSSISSLRSPPASSSSSRHIQSPPSQVTPGNRQTPERTSTPVVSIPPGPETQYSSSYIIADKEKDYTSLATPTPVREGTTLKGASLDCQEEFDILIEILTGNGINEFSNNAKVNRFLDRYLDNPSNILKALNYDNTPISNNKNNNKSKMTPPRKENINTATGEGSSASAPASTVAESYAGNDGTQTPPAFNRKIDTARKDAIGRVILDNLSANKKQVEDLSKQLQQMEDTAATDRETMRKMQQEVAKMKMSFNRNNNRSSISSAAERVDRARTCWGWIKWVVANVLCLPSVNDDYNDQQQGVSQQNEDDNYNDADQDGGETRPLLPRCPQN